MKISSFPLKARTTVLFFCLLVFVAGLVSYFQLGRLEDPTYTIKMCVVATVYPGASAQQVHDDVAVPLTAGLRGIEEVMRVESRSEKGLALLYVNLGFEYTEDQLPGLWTKIRQKVNDLALTLPPGTKTVVQDDFGDVYGQFYALQGDGYTLSELEDYAQTLKRELSGTEGVARVSIVGGEQEAVYLDFSASALASLGLPPEALFAQLLADTVPATPGTALVGDQAWRIDLGPSARGEDELRERVILSTAGLSRLGDLADISRQTVPATFTFDFNGRPALGIGISTISGGNVQVMGKAIKETLARLESSRPAGMTLTPIYLQSDEVATAVKGFLINVGESVLIVIAVLLLFMGLHTGLVVALVLVLTIAATLATMNAMGIFMQIVSLGSLILALGMLVDNAIVMSEGLLVGLQRHENLTDTSARAVAENFWPLLGGTLIAALSFSPIGLNNDLTGEYCRSLFQVVAISLLWSWGLALLATPALGSLLLRGPKQQKDPYQRVTFRAYRRALVWTLRHKVVTLAGVIGLFALSAWGFFYVPFTFFPSSLAPYFTVDLWSPQGTSLEAHRARSLELATALKGEKNVRDVAVSTGSGGLRFMLTINPELPNTSYSQLLVHLDDATATQAVLEKAQQLIEADPHLTGVAKAFSKGGGFVPKIEARLSGGTNDQLRRAGDKIAQLFKETEGSLFVRTNWREPVASLRPRLSQENMRQLGLSRSAIARAIAMTGDGAAVGLVADEGKTLPLMARIKDTDLTASSLNSTPLWGLGGRTSPLGSLASATEVVWEDAYIHALDGVSTLTVQSELTNVDGANDFWRKIHTQAETIAKEADLDLQWGGEHETSTWATESVLRLMPYAALAMFFITVALFNALRPPLIIYLCMPLVLIGVTPALLLTGQSFSFMALLGLLSLFGMLAKNSIVLLDQISTQFANTDPFQAIVHSGVSRLRPVTLSALTTVLGMIPLVRDQLFAPLAITIMAGLGVATALTLFVVPLLTALFYGVKEG